jgi:hypothetical protein
MNIALTYYKCIDDWRDEHKILQYCCAKLLMSRFKRLC